MFLWGNIYIGICSCILIRITIAVDNEQNIPNWNNIYGTKNEKNYDISEQYNSPEENDSLFKTGRYSNTNYIKEQNNENTYFQGRVHTDPNKYFAKKAAFKDASYFVVASRIVRPGLVYRVAVSILRSTFHITVRGSISRDGVEITADSKDVTEDISETLLMTVPPTSVNGTYKLRIEGQHKNVLGGIAFINETELHFSQRSMTILIQTDKPTYKGGDTVRFRTIPITTELKGFDNAIDVYMLDPNKHILRRWLSRQSNLGVVGLHYKLSDQPTFGKWTIRVIAQGQVEEINYLVEEFYQTRFEVNVTMPAIFFTTDSYIYGKIMANFTSGAPVKGNLTLKASIFPSDAFNTEKINQKYRLNNAEKSVDLLRDNYMFNEYEKSRTNYQYQYPIEKYLKFDEELPFWFERSEQIYDSWTGKYKRAQSYLRLFNGTYEFKYPMNEFESLVPSLDGMEIMITATVGERFYDELISGYSIAKIYNSSIKMSFLGGPNQVFKPTMPFSSYLTIKHFDGSAVNFQSIIRSTVQIGGYVESNSGARREFYTRIVKMSDYPGVWELNIDLRNDLNLNEDRLGREFLNTIKSMKLQAVYSDEYGRQSQAELFLVSYYSPNNHLIKVSTSTKEPKVGEYIIFHIRANFFIESFNYLIISKGIVLVNGRETIQEGVRTMAIVLSSEMAPVSTIVIWNIDHQGNILTDSLTFTVDGISRNNFTVYVNNRKARTGEKVEVAIFGEPGTYVGLSAIDSAMSGIKYGNDISYTEVMEKLSSFDDLLNATYQKFLYFEEANENKLSYFPHASYDFDANKTFEYAGLVVFTDGVISSRPSSCNLSLGLEDCLAGGCFRSNKRCDGIYDCSDGSDETHCDTENEIISSKFLNFRFNRIQRHYDNVWLWKDINIGPHGRYIFNIEVPDVPAHWIIKAFSISPSNGLGVLKKPLEYIGVQPFFINIEMPSECREGEQVGIRTTVFNYMTSAIEATVVLHGSSDYKFVHVEEDGIVRSYNPRTSFGEHHFFIYIEPQDYSVVYIPIVPTRLGEIEVTIHAETLLGTDYIVRKILVNADGLPQYRHQSMLLDLSNRALVLQYMHVNITETPIIPYEVERYFVYGSNKARITIVGDVVGPIFPTMPINASSLLSLPIDSAENNMFTLAANLYTIMYMRYINQRNKTMEKNAFYYMNIAYQRQMSFMKEDGSFTLFRSDWNNSESSVWLTAYCARVFQEAAFYEWENYIYIDPLIIRKSINWILQHQTSDGSFYETASFPDRKLNLSINSQSDYLLQRNITLTAHVLITLAMTKDLSGNLGARVSVAQQRAIFWIEKNLNLLKETKDPYPVAIVTYSLMLARAAIAEHAFAILAKHQRVIGEYRYWGNIEVPLPPSKLENQKNFLLPRLPYEYDSLNIETTAYALMVYVLRREVFIEPIVRWLNAQRLNDGGWASTQDTSVALKALIEYTAHSRIRDVSSLKVTVEPTSLNGKTKDFFINDDNLAQLQYLNIPNAWGTVKVQAKGAGFAVLQMHVQYNVDYERFQTKPPVPAFEIFTKAVFHGRNQSLITYVCCQRWTNTKESIRSGLTVLDVTTPTGYFIQQQNLDEYVLSGRVRNLQRARYMEKGVIFYFAYLDQDPVCVNFTMERWYPVANMSRYLPIRVYDYYAPERFNETIFDALPTYLLNICEVCGSSQCPYCSIYNTGQQIFSEKSFIVLVLAAFFILKFYNFNFCRHMLLV